MESEQSACFQDLGFFCSRKQGWIVSALKKAIFGEMNIHKQQLFFCHENQLEFWHCVSRFDSHRHLKLTIQTLGTSHNMLPQKTYIFLQGKDVWKYAVSCCIHLQLMFFPEKWRIGGTVWDNATSQRQMFHIMTYHDDVKLVHSTSGCPSARFDFMDSVRLIAIISNC